MDYVKVVYAFMPYLCVEIDIIYYSTKGWRWKRGQGERCITVQEGGGAMEVAGQSGRKQDEVAGSRRQDKAVGGRMKCWVAGQGGGARQFEAG